MRPVRVSYEQKLSVKCPKCGAGKNKMCRPLWSSAWGYTHTTLCAFHKDRRLAWLDWALKDAAKQ